VPHSSNASHGGRLGPQKSRMLCTAAAPGPGVTFIECFARRPLQAAKTTVDL
jgi:hypothetical protein